MNNIFYLIYTHKVLPITTTGNYCALNCAHCNKKYLSHMVDIKKIEPDLISGRKRYNDLLISGGSTSEGFVPFFNYYNKLKSFKNKGFRLNIHTGLISDKYFKFIDIADSLSIDLVGDSSVIRDVYNLDYDYKYYFNFFEKLIYYKEKNKLKLDIVPHITLGINGGKPSGEKVVIDFLKDKPIKKVVFIIFIPTPGTKFESKNPPSFNYIDDIFYYARSRLKEKILITGCMRPRGFYREIIDLLTLKNNFNALVNPSFKIIDKANNINEILINIKVANINDVNNRNFYRFNEFLEEKIILIKSKNLSKFCTTDLVNINDLFKNKIFVKIESCCSLI